MRTDRRQPRSKFRDMAMGVLLALVMAGGLTALITRAAQTARADVPTAPAAAEQHCTISGQGSGPGFGP